MHPAQTSCHPETSLLSRLLNQVKTFVTMLGVCVEAGQQVQVGQDLQEQHSCTAGQPGCEEK